MSKIQTINITNLKAIGALQVDFKGATAIITGANNSGKSTFLRSIPDRIRGIRPDIIVKQGEESGAGYLTLTDGCKFEWQFNNEGKDKLLFFTKEGFKVAASKEICNKYFPPVFDIDEFLQATPKEQAKKLQKALGIDFTAIDARYKAAFDDRTDKNREAERERVKLAALGIPDKVESVDLTDLQVKKMAERTRLNNLYLANVQANKDIRNEWEAAKKAIDLQWAIDNQNRRDALLNFSNCREAVHTLSKAGFQHEALTSWLTNLFAEIPQQYEAGDKYPAEPVEKYIIPEKPEAPELERLDAEILAASETNDKARKYTDYINQQIISDKANEAAETADKIVKSIEAERKQMISNAKFPKGIEITPDGITVDGLPLNKNQVSTSKLYTTALRIASMNLGEVKTLYFDASFLDKKSLLEIEGWAQGEGLQLLIERPDFEGGDIKYELIETISETKQTLF